MSVFGKLFGSSDSNEPVNHPCTNCPSDCEIYPKACDICKPYKEKLIDAVYNVEHMDEIISRYEVDLDPTDDGGSIECPHCGGNTTNIYVCDYCGSRLREGSEKIKVRSVSEIPSPILGCQDLIFERYAAVKKYPCSNKSEGIMNALQDGWQSGIMDMVISEIAGTSEVPGIGNKMAEQEIKDMAKYYGISVSRYLNGLDMGKYLSLTAKNKCVAARKKYASTMETAKIASTYFNAAMHNSKNECPPPPPNGPTGFAFGGRPGSGHHDKHIGPGGRR